jgi:hypothetical protein
MAALIKIDHSLTSAAGRANAIRFCSRCGEPAEEPPRAESGPPRTRVCAACGMGMLLSCAREALPGAGAAFLIATVELTVSALSETAETVFGTEQTVLGSPLGALITSPLGDDRLGATVTQAALRAMEPTVLPVRGLTENAGAVGTMAARISTCGRPRAALITMEPSGFGRR